MRAFVIALVSAAACLGAAYGVEEKVILEHRMGETNEFYKRAELSITYNHGVATDIKLIEKQNHIPTGFFDGSEIYQIRISSGNTENPYYVASMDPSYMLGSAKNRGGIKDTVVVHTNGEGKVTGLSYYMNYENEYLPAKNYKRFHGVVPFISQFNVTTTAKGMDVPLESKYGDFASVVNPKEKKKEKEEGEEKGFFRKYVKIK